jgi:hypothetical protein
VAVPQLHISGYFLAHCSFLKWNYTKKILVQLASQLVDFAKPGVDIAIERDPSPIGVSCNFLVTNNNTDPKWHSYFIYAQGKNYTVGA